MASTKQLGLYWGNTALYCTEIISLKPAKVLSIPLDQSKSAPTDDSTFISANMLLVSNIEEQLKKHKISTTTVNLSLPTKDIIFRTFTIPWMTSNELKGVVTFEISKYIPFSLEELWYSYHPITITENISKKIKIIFVAVRKDTLENYTNVLESAGLQLNVIEPCSQSLLRILVANKAIENNKTIAVIEKGEQAGKITIFDQGVPQFVREFHLKIPSKNNPADQQQSSVNLINEIRISIDYFTRQENIRAISEIKILMNHPSAELAEELGNSLNIPTSILDLQNIVQKSEIDNIAYLNAFGVGIHNSVTLSSNFDFSRRAATKTKTGISAEPSTMSAFSSLISTVLICGGLLTLTFFITNQIIEKPKKNVQRLEAELGNHKDMLIEKIEESTKNTLTSTSYLKSIRTRSNAAFYLTILPNLLPEGVWLKSIDLNYPDAALVGQNDINSAGANLTPNISISGYAYTDNVREQFKLVNQLLKNVRENTKFSSLFSQINLETVRADRIGDLTLTFYQIKCQ